MIYFAKYLSSWQVHNIVGRQFSRAHIFDKSFFFSFHDINEGADEEVMAELVHPV